MRTLKAQGLRRRKHASSYFRGAYNKYGRYQWDIKYRPGFNSEYEIESAVLWAFGEHVKIGTRSVNGNSIHGFEVINEIIGRPVEAHIAGRSGGWVVVDTELTEAELKRIDRHIEECLKALPEFLKEERALNSGGNDQ